MSARAPRPRVLHVITRFSRGGSEQRLRDVLDAVPGDHHLIVGRDSGVDQVEAISPRISVTWCDSLVREIDPANDARSLRQLVRTMRNERFDVVHTHQAKSGFIGRVAARAARVPVVYHSASMASFGPGYGARESRAFALAERSTAPLVRRYFVVGEDLAARLAANGVARRRLEVVRSSLDLTAFVPPAEDERGAIRVRLGLDPSARVLCYVGSLERRKGVDLLPAMMLALRGRGDHAVQLVVAGDGPLRDDLGHRVLAEGLDAQVRLLGHVPFVAEVMRAADALVLPSSAEGLPQVLVQAMATGLPFVAYDVDGVGELCRLGAQGSVVPVGDEMALTNAVVTLMTHPVAERRRSVDDRVLDQWSRDEVAGQYRRAYDADAAARRKG